MCFPNTATSKLKNNDHHFDRLFEKHNELDQHIKNMESHIDPGTEMEVEKLKKEKLQLKDDIFQILRKASEQEAS